MNNRFNDIGIRRALNYTRLEHVNNDSFNALLNYYHDVNAPSIGETEIYMGTDMPNIYLQAFVNISFNEYFHFTTYSSEKYGSSSSQRYTPNSRVPIGVERFRDCSSFVWDVLNIIGFNVGSLWYTGSAYDYLVNYEVPFTERQAGDLILYWKTGDKPIGGGSSHMMFYIGNDWYIDTTGGKLTACAQRNRYNLNSGYCRFYRIPAWMYPRPIGG